MLHYILKAKVDESKKKEQNQSNKMKRKSKQIKTVKEVTSFERERRG